MNQCNISWSSFRKDICDGFSHLQQEQEFVDMTLAAEGHLVKVHRNLIALSSPYLREMLHSASCQHPVIFLSNISHDVLSLLLEYIYTGEVNVPKEKLNTLLEAAKALHIKGLKDVIASTTQGNALSQQNLEEEMCNTKSKRTGNTAKKYHLNSSVCENEDSFAKNRNKNLKNNIHDINKQPENLENDNFSDLIKYHDTTGKPFIISNQLTKSSDVRENISSSNSIVVTSEEKEGNNHFIINLIAEENKHPNVLNNNENNLTDQGLCYDEIVLDSNNDQTILNADTENISENINSLDFVSDPRDMLHDDMDFETALETHEVTAKESYGSANTQNVVNLLECSDSRNKCTNTDSFPLINVHVDLNQLNNANQKSNSVAKINNVSMMEIENQNSENSANNYNANILYNDNRGDYITPPTNQFVESSQNSHIPSISVDVPTKSIHIDLTAPATSQKEIDNATDLKGNTPLYAVSKRRCLQLILNRYMYSCHYDAYGGQKRRWRCIDYRKLKCKAYIDTKDDIIVSRKFAHSHPFHDAQIFKKGQSSMVYTSINKILQEITTKKN